jgi:hypothetical protein
MGRRDIYWSEQQTQRLWCLLLACWSCVAC